MILFGIAALIIASCGVLMWQAGLYIGPYIFFIFLITGLLLCLRGFVMNRKDK